jgi:hypothetical protein
VPGSFERVGGIAVRTVGRRALVTAAMALAILASGCGSDSDDGELPAGSVARVGDDLIGKPQLQRRVALERRIASRGASAKQIELQALTSLLRERWIEQQAEEHDVDVSPAEARRSWRQVARRQFKTRKARRRFLGRRSEAELVAQLRLQTLVGRIEAKIRAEQGSAAAKRFGQEAATGWRASTTCAPRFTVPGCRRP